MNTSTGAGIYLASIRTAAKLLVSLALILMRISAWGKDTEQVGHAANQGTLVATGQFLHPAGESVSFVGRPVDLALAPDGSRLYIKDDRGLVVVDTSSWQLRQELPFPKEQGGGSMHGIAVGSAGNRIYATTSEDRFCEAAVNADGQLGWLRSMRIPGPGGRGASYPCGIALSRDGRIAYVCLSRNNSLALIDLGAGKLIREIPVGVAPFDVVLSPDETIVFVSNWGGRRPRPGEKAALSSGTPTLVDDRGVASSGTVSRVNLREARVGAEVETGLHPAGLALSRTGKTLYVANANSDTVSILDAGTLRVVQQVVVRPDPRLSFGSAPNALALSPDEKTLFAANGGNNAVAVLSLAGPKERPAMVRGYIPTGWYPGAVVTGGRYLFIANVKGEGSRTRKPGRLGYNVYDYRGTVTRMAVPTPEELSAHTKRVLADSQIPQLLRLHEKVARGVAPVPVPRHVGEPSVFEHVVYVIKENRTYDQVFGDLKKANGEPRLCLFGREISPNHHALAESFVVLDNFYCNGVLSADGHSWATEGNVTDHLEKSFGGFTRSYTFGDDPLTYSSSGFLWDNVLAHGLSFRNYGELSYTETQPKEALFADIYKDYQAKAGRFTFTHSIGLANLRRYSAPDYPGWNLNITDAQRLDAFLKEFRNFEKRGNWPALVMVYLPQDHTSGSTPDMPTPRAHLADNDLALGRLIELISHSHFWKTTCIFVIEDDPQNGFDHVDGHRSLCLVVSPYTKRRQVIHHFYNQTSVIHTIEQILGVPAMNQLDGLAPLMTECFALSPDFAAYTALPATVPLDELNPKREKLSGPRRALAEQSLRQNLNRPDLVEEDTFNRILWHTVKGNDAPYRAEFAGAHGHGLKALQLSPRLPDTGRRARHSTFRRTAATRCNR